MPIVLSEGPSRKGFFGGGTDSVLKLGAAASGAALIGSIVFLSLGLKDYRAMQEMKVEWNEVSRIAYGEAGAGTDLPQTSHDRFVELSPDGAAISGMSAESGQAVYVPNDMLYKSVDLAALQAINPDVSGFLHIPGIQVDYPVLKEQEKGEYYYINHDIYGEPDRYGSVFELCDEERGESAITWVFGHHMASGAMFSGLYQYLEPGFASTPIYLYRDGYRYEYEAFGACVIDMDHPVYDFGRFALGSDEYAELLSGLSTKNRMETDAAWGMADEPMLLLSTCYGGSGTRNRLIILAREARMAVTPEYYRSLQEVQEYGGDESGIPESEAPEGATGVDGSSGISGMDAVLDYGQGAGSGTGVGTGVWDGYSYDGGAGGMAGLFDGEYEDEW